jgi:hypothetical protein
MAADGRSRGNPPTGPPLTATRGDPTPTSNPQPGDPPLNPVQDPPRPALRHVPRPALDYHLALWHQGSREKQRSGEVFFGRKKSTRIAVFPSMIFYWRLITVRSGVCRHVGAVPPAPRAPLLSAPRHRRSRSRRLVAHESRPHPSPSWEHEDFSRGVKNSCRAREKSSPSERFRAPQRGMCLPPG